MLPINGKYMQVARVVSRSELNNGIFMGTYNKNPILDTIVFDVQFPDGSISQYTTNMIIQDIFSQVDDDGYRYQLLDHIVNYRSDDTAIKCGNEWVVSKNGNKSRKHTTKGWFFEVMWKDGTNSWVPLKEIKENHSIETTEYTRYTSIIHEPAIIWWAPHVLTKRDQIIGKVIFFTKKKAHKYGIQIPRSVEEAYNLDKEMSKLTSNMCTF